MRCYPVYYLSCCLNYYLKCSLSCYLNCFLNHVPDYAPNRIFCLHFYKLRTRNRIQKPDRGGFGQSPHRTNRICILSAYVLDSSSRDSRVQADILHTHLYISSNFTSMKEELPHKSCRAVSSRAVHPAPVHPAPVPLAPLPPALVPPAPVPPAPVPPTQIPPAPVSALRDDSLIILRT